MAVSVKALPLARLGQLDEDRETTSMFTTLVTEQNTYNWTVANLECWPSDLVELKSEHLLSAVDGSELWQIALTGNVKWSAHGSETLRISLHIQFLAPRRRPVVRAVPELQVFWKKSRSHLKGEPQKFSKGVRWGKSDLIIIRNFREIENATLYVRFNVRLLADLVESDWGPGAVGPGCDLVQDLRTLLSSKVAADVKLCAGGRELLAHRAVLAARSPVFATMFSQPTREFVLGRVEVDDLDADTLAELLTYIYTGEVPALRKKAAELLAAAAKYSIPRLKALCAREMVARLSVDNAVGVAILLERHGAAAEARDRVLDFIRPRLAEVVATSAWADALASQPQLTAKIFSSLAPNAS